MGSKGLNLPADTEQSTDFNFSISTLYRINSWLNHTNEAAFMEDPLQYRLCLIRVFHEIRPLISKKKDRIEVHNKLKSDVEIALNDYISKKRLKTQIINPQKIQLPRKIFDVLDEWEAELRLDADRAGLYMKRMDDAANALMN